MIELQNNFIVGFSRDEVYIIGKSLIDAWGYPYRPVNIKFLVDREEYKKIDERFSSADNKLQTSDLSPVINALELLYHENGDFEALYDNVTKEDVGLLHKKLETIKGSVKQI
jgi:hypothetical protein